MACYSVDQHVQMIKLNYQNGCFLDSETLVAPILWFTWSSLPVDYSMFDDQIQVNRFNQQ